MGRRSSPGVGARRAAILAAMLARGSEWRRYVDARPEDMRVLEDLWLVEDGLLTPVGVLVAYKALFPGGLGVVLGARRLEEYEGLVRGVSVYAAFLVASDKLLEAIRAVNETSVYVYRGAGWRLVIEAGRLPRIYARRGLLRREIELAYRLKGVRRRLAVLLSIEEPEVFYPAAARLGLLFMATKATGRFIRECRGKMHMFACEEWPYATILDDLVDSDITLGEMFEEQLPEEMTPASYAALAAATEFTNPLIELAIDAGLATGLMTTVYEAYRDTLSPLLLELVKRELYAATMPLTTAWES